MVRMTDLVRTNQTKEARPATPPPQKPPAASPPAAPPAATPPPSSAPPEPPPARPARLSLRSLATSPPVRPATEAPAPVPDVGAPDELFARLLIVEERARASVKSSEAFPWPELQRVIERAIGSLASSAELFWIANATTVPAGTDAIAFHHARVAILSLRVGANVGIDTARLVELGMAAALIDVSLWMGADGRRLDPQSAEYRAHPGASADIVRRWSAPAESIVEAIQQHHELEQGQGYPQRLRGDAIHPHAKILGLIDRYATLTGSGATRGRSRPHEAIRDIVRSKNEEFSPPLIKSLLGEISVFPPGTPVRLNTGEVARVIGVNRNHPLRPRVEVLADAKGHALPAARVIDLGEAPFVYITGPATEQ